MRSLPTAPAGDDTRYQRREMWARRVFVTLLLAFLVAAATGVLGVRTADVSAVASGYEVNVHYGRVTRPGLATPWEVEVRSLAGDFDPDEPVVIETTADYFDLFDENGLDPEPTASTTSDGEFLSWEFDPPDGDTLSVSFDARIEPAVQLGREGVTRVTIGDQLIATLRYRTTVLP